LSEIFDVQPLKQIMKTDVRFGGTHGTVSFIDIFCSKNFSGHQVSCVTGWLIAYVIFSVG